MRNKIEQVAERLYGQCQTPKPNWSQLGEVTKSVWRERAEKELGSSGAVQQQENEGEEEGEGAGLQGVGVEADASGQLAMF